ncbi:MAG: alanine--tRNA ligase [Sulfuriflexus sp.]|nr:alanine--tRNA ligase [Sulfuriflexus sp.]
MMSTNEIRQLFLDYFHDKGHKVVASSSLVPGNDPTLLFTNAGMVPFKETFLGQEKRSYNRATSVQRCVRAGGKHNDLENVGYTARHHTFFEMLGNFSFGDYFKEDAIKYAWEFLTEVVKLPEEKLWITVYEDDDEAADIWLKEIGVSADRITRIGDKPGGKDHESDNFWSMGDTGPCGPCTEIFYDHGEEIAGGPPGTPEEDGDRYIEIWNLVFMQYDRDQEGTLNPLPAPSVDTGMGLERLAAILQDGHENYDIDLFQNLIKAVAKLVGTDDLKQASLRVIADHIRACSFLIVDEVIPSNEGRGYVLRRIIRRAIRHGYKLGIKDTFFYKLVEPLCKEMGEAYPELLKAQAQVERILKTEEERFAETLDQGMKILEQEIKMGIGKYSISQSGSGVKGENEVLTDKPEFSGEVAFKLYDTYGFPLDLTKDVLREKGLELDEAGFDAAMEAQRTRARAASKFDGAELMAQVMNNVPTQFTGYEHLSDDSRISALLQRQYHEDKLLGIHDVPVLEKDDEGVIVLDKSPFYSESGGQVGDTGFIETDSGKFEVNNTQKQGETVLHFGKVVRGSFNPSVNAKAEVDEVARKATELNHSATHLMHAALRKVLGDHVSQKGSLVDPERLRFDFAHFEPVTSEQLTEIENIVNQHIRANHEVVTKLMAIDDARESGAMALFGEKYDDEVRVLSMSEFSVELCGGTHVKRTGDIGLFKITNETGTAAGVRRIEAVTGQAAIQRITDDEARLDSLAKLVKGSRDDVTDKVTQLLERQRKLEKELEQLKGKLASSAGSDLASQAEDVAGIKVLAARLDGADVKSLRDTVDQLKNKLGTAAIVLSSVDGDKITLIAGVSKDATDRIKAGDLVNCVAQQVGGKGGGRPDMAQAGGNDPAALDGALASVVAWVTETVNK